MAIQLVCQERRDRERRENKKKRNIKINVSVIDNTFECFESTVQQYAEDLCAKMLALTAAQNV